MFGEIFTFRCIASNSSHYFVTDSSIMTSWCIKLHAYVQCVENLNVERARNASFTEQPLLAHVAQEEQ